MQRKKKCKILQILTELLVQKNIIFFIIRTLTVDEGKDAFNGMVAAVNSADEKMKAFTGELNKYISQAVGKNMNTEKLIKILQENAPNQVKY